MESKKRYPHLKIKDLKLRVGDHVIEKIGNTLHEFEVTGVTKRGTVSMVAIKGPRSRTLQKDCTMGGGASAARIRKV